MKTLLLLVLALFQTQEKPLNDVERITCSTGNMNCAYFYSNRISIYQKDTLVKEFYLDEKEVDLIRQYHPVFVESKLYFIEHFGGKVYVVQGEVLKRIDNSYTHRSQLLSSIFTYEGGIYRFGGYGFFDARNFITKYNFNANEWDVVQVKGDDLPPGLFDSKTYLLNNELYVLGGKMINEFNRNIFENSNAIWKFNLDDKKWTYIGEFEFFESLLSKKNDFIFQNNLFFLEDQKLYFFDPLRSVIEETQKLPIQDKIDPRFPIIIAEGKIHYLTRTSNEKSLLINNTESVFLLEQVVKEIERIHKKSEIHKYLLLLVLLIGATITFTSRYKKKASTNKTKSWSKNDQIVTTENELIYQKLRVKISHQEKKLINLLLSEKMVQTDRLLEIFIEEEVTHTQKLRMKNELIFRLNTKFQVLCNTDVILIRQIQSPKDKRILIYSLNIKNIKTI